MKPEPGLLPPNLGRRDLLKVAAVAGGIATTRATGATESLELPKESAPGLVDTNVYLSHWPLRRLPFDETAALVAKLRSQGVTQAWAGSFDGLLHRDIASVNARLAQECRREGQGLLVPFGSVNPNLPDWEDDLRRCAEEHRMPGIRLHPTYHGCTLDDPDFAKLLELAASRGLLVQIATNLEDRRMMHPLLQIEPPGIKPLAGIAKKTPGLRLELLGLKSPPPKDLLDACDACMDFSMIEGVGGIANLLDRVAPDRILFGSHAPLFYFESSRLKLQESPLDESQLRAIRWGNAQRLLARG